MPKRWIVWGLKSAIDRLTRFFGRAILNYITDFGGCQGLSLNIS